jgi:hypothetical protein
MVHMGNRDLLFRRLNNYNRLSKDIQTPSIQDTMTELKLWHKNLTTPIAMESEFSQIEEYDDDDADLSIIDLGTSFGKSRFCSVINGKNSHSLVKIQSSTRQIYQFQWYQNTLIGPCLRYRFTDRQLICQSIAYGIKDIAKCQSYTGSKFAKMSLLFAEEMVHILDYQIIILEDASTFVMDGLEIRMTPYLRILRGYGMYEGYGFFEKTKRSNPRQTNHELSNVHKTRYSFTFKHRLIGSILEKGDLSKSQNKLLLFLDETNLNIYLVVEQITNVIKKMSPNSPSRICMIEILQCIVDHYDEVYHPGQWPILMKTISNDGEMVLINRLSKAPYFRWLE